MNGHEYRGKGKGWGRGQDRAGQGRLGLSSTSTRQGPYHSVRQGVFLVQQDSDEEAVGARVCHVGDAQQGCS